MWYAQSVFWLKFINVIIGFVCTRSVLAHVKILDVEIVTPGLTGSSVPSTITLTGPAFDVALENLKSLYGDLNFSHIYLDNKTITDCFWFQNEVQYMLSRWYYSRSNCSKSMPVIVTPGCTESLFLNQLAAGWNILLITTSSSDPVIKDKRISPTWINTNIFPTLYYGDIFYQLFQKQQWSSVYVVLDESSSGYYLFMARIAGATLEKRKVQTVNIVYSSGKEVFDFQTLLDRFSERSRVMIFLGSPSELRKLLLCAYAKNRTNGDYVYIASVSFPYKPQGIFTWKADDADDKVVRSAYASLLFVTMVDVTRDNSPYMDQLRHRWNSKFISTPFYENINLQTEPPIPLLVAVNTAIEMLGQVLNETLADNQFNQTDGSALAKRFWNRTFETTSGSVILDQFGDRAPSVSVSYFDNVTGEFQVFLQSVIQDGVFQWRDIEPVNWFNTTLLPPNEPACGYTGENVHCRLPATSLADLHTGLGVTSILFVSGGGWFLFFLRRQRREQRDESNRLWWQLNGERLHSTTCHGQLVL